MTLDGATATFGTNIVIPNDGSIGSASAASAIEIRYLQ